jgi:hypothetical protein
MKEIKVLNTLITKIEAEKNHEFAGEYNLNSNINILSLEKLKSEFIQDPLLKVNFDFLLSYDKMGKIQIKGNLHLLLNQDDLIDVLEKWKSKKIETDFRELLLNLILQSSSLQAIKIEEELGLPLHIKIPMIKIRPAEDSAQKDAKK